MNLPLIVVGGGGHASVLIESLLFNAQHIIGYTDVNCTENRAAIHGVPCVGDDDYIFQYDPFKVMLVNGIGSVKTMIARKQIYDKFKEKGYIFNSVKHPSAIISPHVVLEEGVQVMAGAVIQTGSLVGINSIVNTRASIDHDCKIGEHVHVAPGVVLSGGVIIDDCVHVGIGSTIIQGIHIYSNSTIGAGSLVLKDVQANRIVFGVPAKDVT